MSLLPQSREHRYWLYTALVLTAIYSTLGFTPLVSGFLRQSGLLVPAFVAGLLLILAAIAAAGFRAKIGRIEAAVWLGIIATYLLVIVRMEIPEERTHLLEYGVLAIFAHEALKERWRDKRSSMMIALAAIGLTGFAGTLDEVIQYQLPNRTFDLRDIGFNLVAGMMAVLSSIALDWAKTKARAARD